MRPAKDHSRFVNSPIVVREMASHSHGIVIGREILTVKVSSLDGGATLPQLYIHIAARKVTTGRLMREIYMVNSLSSAVADLPNNGCSDNGRSSVADPGSELVDPPFGEC